MGVYDEMQKFEEKESYVKASKVEGGEGSNIRVEIKKP